VTLVVVVNTDCGDGLWGRESDERAVLNQPGPRFPIG
jgi:hypothetical protein